MRDKHNIIHQFLDAANREQNGVALQQEQEKVTYKSLLAAVKIQAAEMHCRGIKKGSKVLVFVPMSLNLYRTVLALFYLGAIPVFIDEWVSLNRLKACVRLVPPDAIIASRGLLFISHFIKSLRKISIRMQPIYTHRKHGTDSVAEVQEMDTALITFTTGSTGLPKAANRTHDFLRAQLDALRPIIPPAPEVSLTLLPIVVLLNLAIGVTTILPPRKFKAKKASSFIHLLETIRLARPATMILSPAIAERLLTIAATADFSSVHKLLTGGGPVFPNLAKELRKALPAAEVIAVFGSTEAEPIAKINISDLMLFKAVEVLEKGLPLGTVDAHASVTIIPWTCEPIAEHNKEEWLTYTLQKGIGEIVVSGHHVLEQYIGNPEAERRNKIRVAGVIWHRTGDLGRLDEQRNLFLYGRGGEQFLANNNKWYYPLLLEYFMKEKLNLKDLALVFYEQELHAFLIKADRNKQEMVAALLQKSGLRNLAFHLWKALPKDPRHLSKVDKESLRNAISK